MFKPKLAAFRDIIITVTCHDKETIRNAFNSLEPTPKGAKGSTPKSFIGSAIFADVHNIYLWHSRENSTITCLKETIVSVQAKLR
jgi:hypothetical protein